MFHPPIKTDVCKGQGNNLTTLLHMVYMTKLFKKQFSREQSSTSGPFLTADRDPKNHQTDLTLLYAVHPINMSSGSPFQNFVSIKQYSKNIESTRLSARTKPVAEAQMCFFVLPSLHRTPTKKMHHNF